MKRKILINLSIILIIIFSLTNVKAAKKEELIEIAENTITENVILKDSELNNYKNNITNEKDINGIKYNFDTIKKGEESKEDNIEVTKEITINDLFDTNNKNTIMNTIQKTYFYNENGVSGDINLQDIKIEIVPQGKYEKIEKLDIPFSAASQNELAVVPKVITQNGYTWNLINVDWEVDTYRTIDNTKVPTSYKGVKHYQRVGIYNYPNKYRVTAIYSGTATKVDKSYSYTLTYQKAPVPEKKIDIKKIVTIVIGAIGILVLIFVIIYKRNKDKEEKK